MSASIRDTVRHKLLTLFAEVQADRKLIVLDQSTVKIVDAVCLMNELLDTGAFLVETIEKKRQPYPGMQALYFVAPTEDTVQLLGKDFEKRPTYREAHLFFTTEVPQELFESVARSPAGAYIRAFQELYVDFIAAESRAFHHASARLFCAFFGKEVLAAFETTARKIVSTCVSMNVLPAIRYRKSDLDRSSAKLAVLVQEQLERFLGRNPDFRRGANATGELLIADRTVDLMAPLLHEFTYQAMAHDLLPIAEGNRYECKGAQSARVVTLDENDALWTSMRHTHIAECSQVVIARFNQFMRDNPAATKSAKIKEAGGVTNLGELRDMMGSLGEFQELKALYSLHLTIAQECMNVFEAKHLADVAAIEQDMATGLDSAGEGGVMKGVWNRIAPWLNSDAITSGDKARLLLLYLLAAPMGDAERRGIVEKCPLTAEHARAVQNMALLSQDVPRAGVRLARKREVEEAPFDVSRYTTEVKRILRDATAGALPADQFPYVKAPSASAGRAAPVSLRTRAADEASAAVKGVSEKPVMMFVIGGVTWSEIRAAYEVSAASKRDCFLGSTHIITPEEFLQHLAAL